MEFDADVSFASSDAATFAIQFNGVTEITGNISVVSLPLARTQTQNEAITFEGPAPAAGTTIVTVVWNDAGTGGPITIATGDHVSLLVEDVSA